MQRFLPAADLTIMLDIAPDSAARRKSADRDRYERDLALLGRVRESYRRLATQATWLMLDADRPAEQVAEDVMAAVAPRLAPR
jgi:thymidylate kinase